MSGSSDIVFTGLVIFAIVLIGMDYIHMPSSVGGMFAMMVATVVVIAILKGLI